mmetsp:Transcript_15581/g.23666  ORF Transcript_15581/g.23666 Transcript_15581/m.23666 type:complete len:376 (+) Transcript_15581:142-1269(+)|eukprot:CAMPEP_0194296336 /NCGR_PEP_ID=MMETSP0169-20130528/55879_1 /TAXON_ID=218684 /ORGANISM="Corethron pennatum, Strain L29A3" /LENGTH=375 /DNA_ID=CAMNT_0039045773 /DNA_START=132 /DNA_END=1259 /DNA_ORIENTATION=+
MLKISALFIPFFARQTFAYVLTTQIGACVDEALYSGNYTGFHCDYHGGNCADGETWVTPKEVTLGGYPDCGCGENFEANPHMRGCYGGGGVINCRPQHEAPCEGYNMTNRMKTGPGIEADPTCGHGSLGFGAFDASPFCGKRCTCSFGYHSGNLEMRSMIFAGETNHGYCESTNKNPKKKKRLSYCSASLDCASTKHTYVESHTLEEHGVTCPCDRTRSGACVTGKKGSTRMVSRCAVAADSCSKPEKFLSVTQLAKEKLGVDCMLCKNTWDCEDDPKYKFKHKKGKRIRCKQIAKSRNKEKLCEREEKIRENCSRTCETCCADDVRKILFTDNDEEVTCVKLRTREDKDVRCMEPEIASTCTKTCKTCGPADDD